MNSARSFPRSSRFWTAFAEPVHKMARDEHGWALVSVLLTVAILAMIAGATQMLLLSSAAMEQRAFERAHASGILDAAIVRTILGISDARLDQRWRVDGSATTFRFSGVEVQVKVQDQLGLIDLNAADGSMIKRLMFSMGLDDDAASAMTDKILDWRSATDLKRLHGANDADYAAAGYPYHPRHGPFQSVSELRLVLGMTPSLFARLEPALTVYSGRPELDPNLAPAEVLRALYAGDPEQVAQTLAAQNQGSSDNALGARPGVLSTAIPLSGRTFRISAELHVGPRRYVRDTVVLLTSDEARPYLVLAWR